MAVEQQKVLGFIGIGLMGKPMVTRLLAAGYKVFIWNRSLEKCKPLEALGASCVPTVQQLVSQVDVIMLCLADTQAVEQISLEEDGLLDSVQKHQLIIDFSSISPSSTRHIAQKMTEKGAIWLDIPVSGGVLGAEQGTLVMMAGGSTQAIDSVRSILAHLSSRVTRMGDVGAGQVTKVCNQMIVASNAMVIAEVVALAQQSGVDAQLLASALAGGFADSKPFQILAPQMADHQFEPIKWHVRTLLKDVELAADLAKTSSNPIPMSNQALQLLRLHAGRGYAEQDPATLIKLYSKE